jgi:uncharacterized membrane protein YccC
MPVAEASQDAGPVTEKSASPPPAKYKNATKTALSLTLAYLLPMALGWPQPQTAATTVMLIAATGLVSDSLQKGILRVLGTVAGAVIGLSLIAAFPQDRLVYLLAVSITVAFITYLYNAYQGDSTVFMLTSVVTLMVFNGGDAEGAFLYGVDRAYMTAFGVIVYTVVASTLWPVKAVDNTLELAASVASGYSRAFTRLVDPTSQAGADSREQLAELMASEEALQTHFASVKTSSDQIAAYRGEWNAVISCYEELEGILVPALQQESGRVTEFSHFIGNYPALTDRVEAMFRQVQASWQGQRADNRIQPLAVEYIEGSLRSADHLAVAAVATRAELLDKIQQLLLELQTALDSLMFNEGDFVSGRRPTGKPAFIWLDLENAKTAVRAFVTFWIATTIWLVFNPPGGFMLVTLSTVLVPLVSYTPVAPRLLFILFTLGFMFALPAYVFLLPQLTHWLELAAFMFTYAFFGLYLFQGPVAIFYLLGLFTLGIQNTMSYNFDGILLLVLTFYMLCSVLIITTHFPFTSKPERIYPGLCRRFFHGCARLIQTTAASTGSTPWWIRLQARHNPVLLAKMHSWGAKIDTRYFAANSPQQLAALNQACDLLQGQLQVLHRRREEFAENRLIVAARRRSRSNLLVELCDTLADNRSADIRGGTAFAELETRLKGIGEELDELRRTDNPVGVDRHELAQFYVYLNLQASVLQGIRRCYEAQQALDWQQFTRTRM